MSKPLTQQGAFRRDRKALERAKSKGYTERDVVMEMTKTMDDPTSAKTVIEAAAAVNYMNALRNRETPIADAVDSLLQPSPSGAGEPA